MLDQETKRKIDNARDILVGKVPDPKSQVEQITIALIYKFMDDMDKESEEWGGKASFFTGKYEKFAWSKIFDPRLGGFDLIALYSDAMIEMNKNPNLPQLFRDIFKNAYLPYRDPETLKSFLKEINEFTYDHSERLGDAFEYLLSIMDSQGEAGQFRTPRHIIDFIVEIVGPKKNETILDPACGTAGFLISSYKHILRTNTKYRTGDQLTPDEKKRLMRNFTGYDISPDMVRLSLVNLYLHGFSDPKIHEYDTLTSEERWDETADVVLANPPFMTPKGGIRPHNRFSVRVKRSEVLFVDYIVEHLNPSGRAGVIVPEGIIFQSSNAYKNLRKMLVEDYLWAVVSLPMGVFQPYSGVKTSILLMDKTRAKQSDEILFIQVSNDGTDMGAKRSAIEGSDLPTALSDLKAFHNNEQIQSEISFPIKKEKILTERDYSLTTSRYIDSQIIHSFYEPFRLGVYITESKERIKDQNVDVWSVSNQQGFINSKEYFKKDVPSKNLSNYKIINPEYFAYNPSRINVGSLAYNFTKNVGCVSPMYVVFYVHSTNLNNIYLLRMLKSKQFMDYVHENAQGGVRQQLKFSSLCDFQIPLPPLSVQEEIVAEFDNCQKIIDGARQVVKNYKPTIKIDPDWEMVALEKACIKITDGTHRTPKYTNTGIPFLRVTDITQSDSTKKFISREEHEEFIKRCKPEKEDILYSKNGTIGVAKMIDWEWEFSIFVSLALLKPHKTLVLPKYLECFLNTLEALNQAVLYSKSGTVTNLHLIEIKKIKIPLPPLSIQQEIVAQIEAEQKIVNANKKLITMYEQKIKDKIKEVWGEK